MVLSDQITNMPNLHWTTRLIEEKKKWERTIGHLALNYFFPNTFLWLHSSTKLLFSAFYPVFLHDLFWFFLSLTFLVLLRKCREREIEKEGKEGEIG